MANEIERKFLVKNTEFKSLNLKRYYLKQGYLNSDKNRTVRVRIADDLGYVTIKGPSNASGTTRFEWEKQISLKEAQQLLELCESGVIEKYRYHHTVGNHLVEIDEFLGDNEGLIVAEIELSNENESFEKPDYLGLEVTGKSQYFNSSLSKHPFKFWA